MPNKKEGLKELSVAKVALVALTLLTDCRYDCDSNWFDENMAKKKKSTRPRKLPDLSILTDNFDYDPITGELTDNITGDIVTGTDKRGYKTLQFRGKTWAAHRICFYLFHRRDPGKKVIDHCDGNPSNNAICNLRAVSHRDNLRNTAASRKKAGGPPKAEPGAHKCFAIKCKIMQ